ncbi:hypothetical protein [Pseudomonas asiatica]|uniref:hypothetical protein n=1 Tax=Pseudomonas asiatica TaxID=2219225 RepID=UPI0010BFF681|nr:hypothetical protein [Pseudomonas asiatica]
MSKATVLIIMLAGSFTASAFSADDEICRAPLISAATQSFEQLDQVDRQSYYYNHTCVDKKSESSSGFDIVVDTVVEQVPFKVGGGAQSTNSSLEQWCSENKNYARDKSFSRRVYKTVFEPALASFNSCIAAKNSNLAVTVKPLRPHHLVVTMKNNSHNARFQGVKISPEKAATCEITYKNKTYKGSAESRNFKFEVGEVITFDCIRNLSGGNSYPEATFDFKNTLQNYTYVMAMYDEGLASKRPPEPVKYLTPMDGVIVSVTAYWAGGHQSFTKKCMADPAHMTFVGTVSTKIHRDDTVPYCLTRADFNNEEPCTGGDEHCKITTAKGCYVSTEWLNWYKDTVTSKGLAISSEQVCAPQNKI